MGTTAESWCRLERSDAGSTLFLAGDWRLPHLGALDAALDETVGTAPPGGAPISIDGAALAAFDTAAALLLLRRLGASGMPTGRLVNFDPRHGRVVELVSAKLTEVAKSPANRPDGALATLGRHAIELRDLLDGHLEFLGRSAAELGGIVLRPRRLRTRELAAQLQQVCLNAVPVTALVTFLIGVVFAYLLGMQAEKYGANIFVVDGVAIGMARELSPIIVATIIAGRSGAAFTAQLGTMRLTEEIDAIRTLGLSPMQVLVIPRLLALMIALPLLVFVGDVMGNLGAMAVAQTMLDITPTTYFERLHTALPLKHFVVGLSKAPVFAIVIAVIGCRMGMTVSRDARSIGINTTSTVVQSIVAVILLDAFFAVFFQEMRI